MLRHMSRRVVYEEGSNPEPGSAKPDPFKGRRGKRGARQYVYRLDDVCRAAGMSAPALWSALRRAGVRIDDFGALVAWLASRR